jgi:predicted SAM-dependent methyltransferase
VDVAPRLGPNEPGGIARLHVGCGPANLMADWWNVDIRAFKGVDEVADVTAPWPWRDLEYVYGEHFLEHLALDQAVSFLGQARDRLRPGGRIRLSTPGLEWVWHTHFTADGSAAKTLEDTYRVNRAFHGWGHQFLYSRPFLEHVLTSSGLVDVRFFAYGESDDPNLRNLERHGTYEIVDNWPNVWNVEATRPAEEGGTRSGELEEEIEREFVRYVRSGH